VEGGNGKERVGNMEEEKREGREGREGVGRGVKGEMGRGSRNGKGRGRKGKRVGKGEGDSTSIFVQGPPSC